MTFGDYQNEIHLRGLQNVVPRFPVAAADLAAAAAAAMAPSVWTYVAKIATDRKSVV